MFETRWEEAGLLAREAAIRVCWAQWSPLGALATPSESTRPRAIIDPEALILLSLYLRKDERRLFDFVAWWAETGARLTSVQRLRSLATRLPPTVGPDVFTLFASLASAYGDRRWARHAAEAIADQARPGKGLDEPRMIEASTLWLRLRAGLGVGSKADTLVFLLGLRGVRASARSISVATGYSRVTVRKAVGDMALARLIRETQGGPTEYFAPVHPWAELLELYPSSEPDSARPEVPEWRFWADVFGFLISVSEWSRESTSSDEPRGHVIASRARDVLERHAPAFDLNGMSAPPAGAFTGLDAVDGLVETTRVVAAWISDHI